MGKAAMIRSCKKASGILNDGITAQDRTGKFVARGSHPTVL